MHIYQPKEKGRYRVSTTSFCCRSCELLCVTRISIASRSFDEKCGDMHKSHLWVDSLCVNTNCHNHKSYFGGEDTESWHMSTSPNNFYVPWIHQQKFEETTMVTNKLPIKSSSAPNEKHAGLKKCTRVRPNASTPLNTPNKTKSWT